MQYSYDTSWPTKTIRLHITGIPKGVERPVNSFGQTNNCDAMSSWLFR